MASFSGEDINPYGSAMTASFGEEKNESSHSETIKYISGGRRCLTSPHALLYVYIQIIVLNNTTCCTYRYKLWNIGLTKKHYLKSSESGTLSLDEKFPLSLVEEQH
jgi:hypothetical protein